MRHAVRRCPEPEQPPRAAAAEPSGASAAGSAAVQLPAARWPRRADTDRTARPAELGRHRLCVRSPVNPPGCRTHGGRVCRSTAVADAVVRARVRTYRRCGTGGGHPAVHSAASGPVGVHRQTNRRTCPLSCGRSRGGSAQVAAMEPVVGHLSAAGRTLPGHPRPPAGRRGRTGTGRRKQRTVNPLIDRAAPAPRRPPPRWRGYGLVWHNHHPLGRTLKGSVLKGGGGHPGRSGTRTTPCCASTEPKSTAADSSARAWPSFPPSPRSRHSPGASGLFNVGHFAPPRRHPTSRPWRHTACGSSPASSTPAPGAEARRLTPGLRSSRPAGSCGQLAWMVRCPQ
jgi:hypothetical protein